jgi:ribose transport system substrate-binding protein
MEEKMKKLLLCALIVIMCVGTVFAGGRQAADDRPRVAIALGSMGNAWHAQLRRVIDAAVAHHPDVNWTVRNAQDAQDQINMLNVFRNENFDAMIIMPMDGNLVVPIAEAIFFDGTPTVILNRRINSPNYTALVTGDNFGAGVNAAMLLGERLGGRGNMAVIRMFTGTPIDMDRYNGFSSTMAREFPGINVVTQADGLATREGGLTAMTNILPGFPQIDAVYSQDDESALGVLTAIQNAGRRDIRFLTGVGGTLATYEFFMANDPVYIASMSYFPSMGFDAVEMVVRILRGIPFPKDTIIASQVVGAWNVHDFLDDSY